MSFNIIGTGSHFPECIKTNDDLAQIVNTSDEWITTRTGIKTRHVLTKETLSEIACVAAERAISDAGCAPGDIDLIICSTIQGDYISPSIACVLHGMLGLSCPAFDVNAACPGFVYALDIAASYFARGTVRRVLIVSADAMSRYANWQDRSTCVLFGDAAGAVVLEKGEGLLSIKLTAKGMVDLLYVNGHRGNCPYTKEAAVDSYVKMNGTEVYKFAVTAICDDLNDVSRQAGINILDVDHILPHQANIRIIVAAMDKLGIPREKWHQNIDRRGNTSSATIPTLLDELRREGKVLPGQIIAMTAFGGGLTTGACIIRV